MILAKQSKCNSQVRTSDVNIPQFTLAKLAQLRRYRSVLLEVLGSWIQSILEVNYEAMQKCGHCKVCVIV